MEMTRFHLQHSEYSFRILLNCVQIKFDETHKISTLTRLICGTSFMNSISINMIIQLLQICRLANRREQFFRHGLQR